MVRKSATTPLKRKATELGEASQPLSKKSKASPKAKGKAPVKEKKIAAVKEKKQVASKSKKAPKKVPGGKFDPYFFKTKFHFDEFVNNFSKRPILMERQLFLPNDFPASAIEQKRVCNEFSEAVVNRNWQKLLNLNFVGFREVVTEFYSNISSKEGEFKSYVRGKTIYFTPSIINALLDCPDLEEMVQCQMDEYEENTPINREHFDDILCDGEPEWITSTDKSGEVRNLLQQSMNMKAKLWWTVVQGIILPIKHRNSITHKRLWCLRILMLNQPMDLGLTIAREIKMLHKRRMASLTYFGLISELCKEAGVDFGDLQPMQQGKIDLGWMFEGIPDVKQKGKEKKEVKVPKKESSKDGGSNINFSAVEIFNLMAPIVIEIAEKVGVDASSLRDSPLLKKKNFGHSQNLPSREASSSQLKSVSIEPHHEKSKSSPPHRHASSHKIIAAPSSSSSSSSDASTESNPLLHRNRTKRGIYNPLITEVPTEPFGPQIRESLTPTHSGAAEAAEAPSSGSIEPERISPRGSQSPIVAKEMAAPSSGSIEPEKISPKKGSQNPKAPPSMDEIRRDIVGTPSSEPAGDEELDPNNEEEKDESESETQNFILQARDPNISALQIEVDAGGEVIIDTTRLDEVVASFQPQPILPLIPFIPLNLNIPPQSSDTLTTAVSKETTEFEEENQPSVADEPAVGEALPPPIQLAPTTAEAAASAVQPSEAKDPTNQETQPLSPSLREAAQTMVEVLSSTVTSIPNLNSPAPSSPIKATPIKDVYQRKRGKKARSAEPHPPTPPPKKPTSRSASPK